MTREPMDAEALLRVQVWLAAQSRDVTIASANGYAFNTDSANFQNVIDFMTKTAKVWQLPILNHLAGEAAAAHNAVCTGKVNVASREVERYRVSLQTLRDYLPKALSGKQFTVKNDRGPTLTDFGDVSTKLPAITSDLEEALECFDAARYTATVFHLMRALEATLRQFAKKVRITIDADQSNWYQIVQHVNRAIDQLPNKTAAQAKRKQAYGVVAAHLNAVRIAWRNEVMHPKAKYDAEEAADILVHSKALVRTVIHIL
jgi:hypothetical protein